MFFLCFRNAIYNISLHDLTEIVDQVSEMFKNSKLDKERSNEFGLRCSS